MENNNLSRITNLSDYGLPQDTLDLLRDTIIKPATGAITRREKFTEYTSGYHIINRGREILRYGALAIKQQDSSAVLGKGTKWTVYRIARVSSGILPNSLWYLPLLKWCEYFEAHLPVELRGRVNITHAVRGGAGWRDGRFISNVLDKDYEPYRKASFHSFGWAMDLQPTSIKDIGMLAGYLQHVADLFGVHTDMYSGRGRRIDTHAHTSVNPLVHFSFDRFPYGENGWVAIDDFIDTL